MSAAARVHVLMYHSIAGASGPTSTPASTFRMQMDVLEACGYQPITVSQFVDWREADGELPERPVLITFDDGFADFADSAFPVLHERKWPAVVFLPTRRMGGAEHWALAPSPPRPLMDWRQVGELAAEGIEFGGHSLTHADLTRLSGDRLEDEVRRCGEDIAEHLGHPTLSFAPPYGRSNEAVREEIAQHYRVSFGVRLGRADGVCDILDVPRLEMHYFRQAPRWRSFLQGHSESWFLARQTLRSVRGMVSKGPDLRPPPEPNGQA